jgi:hypothetical protein
MAASLTWFDWLCCIAVPVVKVLKGPLNGLAWGFPLGDLVFEAAENVLAVLKQKQGPHLALESLAQAPEHDFRRGAQTIVQDLAGDAQPAVRHALAVYLSQVRAKVRQSLRRPQDPSGTTVPPGLVLEKAEDLLPFLPTKLPRFKAGDRPLAGSDWELVELLGIGGFGEVWKAEKPLVLPRALKFCLAPGAKERLALGHEAEVLDRIQSQGSRAGIVQIVDTYLDNDPPCLAYEYVAGGDLAGLLQHYYRPRGGATPAEAAHIVTSLALAIGFAHRLDPPIVHRDLKPANILVHGNPEGSVGFKIADFGIGALAARQALATRTGRTMGQTLAETVCGRHTPLYASPQQSGGAPPDVRDDVFSLGVIWYQLLAGEVTKGRPGGDLWKKRLLHRGMAPAQVALLTSCFEDEPKDRPADALVLAEALGRVPPPRPQKSYPSGEEKTGPTPGPYPMAIPVGARPAAERKGREEPEPREDVAIPVGTRPVAERVKRRGFELLAAGAIGLLLYLAPVMPCAQTWTRLVCILLAGTPFAAWPAMAKLRSYGFALAASVAVILLGVLLLDLPGTDDTKRGTGMGVAALCFACLCLVVGVRALLLLGKPEVQAAFSAASASRGREDDQPGGQRCLRVMPPAVGLLVAGIVNVLLLSSLPFDHWWFSERRDANATSPLLLLPGVADNRSVRAAMLVLLFFLNAGLIVSAVQMLRFRWHRVAVAGSIGALFTFLGLPWGIWSLVVLCKPLVKAAFHRVRGPLAA